MAVVFRSLVLALTLAVISAGPFRTNGGAITFSDQHRYPRRPSGLYSPPNSFYSPPRRPSGLYSPPGRPTGLNSVQKPQSSLSAVPGISGGGGGSAQFGETSATSEQTSSGTGQQMNQGQATAVSVQQQSGLGGATQTTNNQGVIQALQEAGGNGIGTGSQSSNNQVNIQSTQLQQNVDGVLVNVNDGNEGIVVVNTNDPTGAIVNQDVINNKPVAPPSKDSVHCRFVCRRPFNNQLYCCDDGTNISGPPDIHGGQCPEARPLCLRQPFVRLCAHDGQCEASDKCCYDACVQAHICKTADPVA